MFGGIASFLNSTGLPFISDKGTNIAPTSGYSWNNLSGLINNTGEMATGLGMTALRNPRMMNFAQRLFGGD